MARQVLDTSVLVAHWHTRRQRVVRLPGLSDSLAWAADLAKLYQSRSIVSTVYIEFICGAKSAAEVELFEAYLAHFDVVDGWIVTKSDLRAAAQIARRVPRDGKPRQFGDCLIRAIAMRLKYDVRSVDRRFPRPSGGSA